MSEKDIDIIEQRSQTTQCIISKFQKKFSSQECKFINNTACVYLTGSFGRNEASEHSDLDLFIVGKSLSKLDQIILQAELIKATRKCKLPDFSGDGEFLAFYTVNNLIDTLGTPDDDKANTFTARLLLLLESKPLLEPKIYDEIVNQIIQAYFQDFGSHRTEFIPAFLINDILRLWRTFCVNYEAKTKRAKENAMQLAKRRLHNYKLKHSRLLTCYSAIIYLMSVIAQQNTVRQEDVKNMVKLAPIERLKTVQKQFPGFSREINSVIQLYAKFLTLTNNPKKHLLNIFQDKRKARKHLDDASTFGDSVYKLLSQIENADKIKRIIIV